MKKICYSYIKYRKLFDVIKHFYINVKYFQKDKCFKAFLPLIYACLYSEYYSVYMYNYNTPHDFQRIGTMSSLI